MDVFTDLRLKPPAGGRAKTVRATHLVPRQRFTIAGQEVEVRFMAEREGLAFWEVVWNPD